MQKIAFFDVDGTLTTGRVWRGLMRYFTEIHPRRLTHTRFWAKHLPNWALVKLKLLNSVRFRTVWAADLAWFYRDLTTAEADTAHAWIVREHVRPMLRPDTVALLNQHNAQGDVTVLVSSGPQPLLSAIGADLGVSHALGTPFETRNGRYTGRLAGPVCIAHYKASMAQAHLARHDITPDLLASHAYADSASDLQLLELVGHPVATHPDKSLLPIARQRGWDIFPADSPAESIQG